MAIVQPVLPRAGWLGSGLEWRILSYTLPLPGDAPSLIESSGGAFYDDAPEHAALGGAEAAAIKFGLEHLESYVKF